MTPQLTEMKVECSHQDAQVLAGCNGKRVHVKGVWAVIDANVWYPSSGNEAPHYFNLNFRCAVNAPLASQEAQAIVNRLVP
jgi:hypothetical protein